MLLVCYLEVPHVLRIIDLKLCHQFLLVAFDHLGNFENSLEYELELSIFLATSLLFTSLTYLHKGRIGIEKKSPYEIFSEFHVSDYVDSEK